MQSDPRHFGFKQFYHTARHFFSALPALVKNRKTKLIPQAFIERVMLAVTQVNGCEACAYAHTKMAFEAGLSREEIKSFLSGSADFVREAEAPAILFAQHYADTDGHPDCGVYHQFVETYGQEKAGIILSAIQVIQLGNILGIPLSALRSRLKGRPYSNSSLLHEIGLPISALIIFPVAFLHFLMKRPRPLCEDAKPI